MSQARIFPPSLVEPDTRSDTPQRSAWRERIVDAERGFTLGFRQNSNFFLYFFTTSVAICFAFVLGLTRVEWSILMLSITLALGSELFYFSIQKLQARWRHQLDTETLDLLCMVRAASMLLLSGAILTIISLLGHRVYQLYG